jgi:hypothetical protein
MHWRIIVEDFMKKSGAEPDLYPEKLNTITGKQCR